MIRINQLTLPVGHEPGGIKKKAAKQLGVPESEIVTLTILRKSIDARKKDRLQYSYIADVTLSSAKRETAAVRRAKSVNIQFETEKPYRYPPHGEERIHERPVVIGAGPAGLFCALSLAENGMRPILLEQGDPVEERVKKVDRFWKQGEEALDPFSNVQFGEGGAGTFSDGKLNTMVKDITGRNHFVLRAFAEAGADSSILTDSKPHIGTDVLRTVVRNLRERITASGGEIRFRTRVTGLVLENEAVAGVRICREETEKEEILRAEQVVLAIGHSARELFDVLERQGIRMEPKPFAVGLRVQHPQSLINLCQYGRENPGELGAAPYKVTARTGTGRGVYSFCMCPGGEVVNASSEAGGLAVNGMSNFNRDSGNANSAVIVTVTPGDFPVPGPLGGVTFQRELEARAFSLGSGRIPIQLFGDFKDGRVSSDFGDVRPRFCGATAFADLRQLMPETLNQAFLEGMEQFGRKLPGFDRADAILAGIESRTSSPLTIVRDERLESNIHGIYPCGEGAGYAGGIMSAAMDGLKVAEEIIRRFGPVE